MSKYATRRTFILLISDNGRGFPKEIAEQGKEGHFGIRGMKERTSRIGGEFGLATSAVSGTQITLRIPGSLIFRKTEPVTNSRLARLRAFLGRIGR